VLVSAFAFGGVPAQALKAVEHRATVCVSPDLLAEYREVPEELHSSGKVSGAQRQALVAGIAAFVARARVVNPRKAVAMCRDPDDNMVLDCCRAAQATVLITGDRDLLALASDVGQVTGLRRLHICSPRTYLERMRRRRAQGC
jgi:putative PIN family toxin of toxin-antitoxin system